MEADTPEVRDGIFVVMDENLVPSDSTGESTVLCFNVKGDYNGYTSPNLQQAMQRARLPRMPVSLVPETPRWSGKIRS